MSETRPHRPDRKNLGRWGEEMACAYLRGIGYRIAERNRFAAGYEIDIIAEEYAGNGTANETGSGIFTVFAEVKTRRGIPDGMKYGRPALSVNHTKRRHILEAAAEYLRKTGAQGQPRIDVIEVYAREVSAPGGGGSYYEAVKIIHIRNAFGIK